MGSRSGFTIVELMVTVTVLVILLTVAVVRLTSTQAGSRDQEREADISALATALESFYQNGSSSGSIPRGYYPGAIQVQAAASTTPPFHNFLEGIDRNIYTAPDRTIHNSFGINPSYASAPVGSNADGSYSDSQARALLSAFHYLYQPLQRDNTFCATYTNCVKFNLYYLNEDTDTVVRVRSKQQ